MSFDFRREANDIAMLVESKQQAYGNAVDATYDVLKTFLSKYQHQTEEGVIYAIPEALLKHILLQVRIIDKQNRIFSNPKGDLMQESPYSDMMGYALLGKKMVEEA